MIRDALAVLSMCVLATAMGCQAIDFKSPAFQSQVPPEMEPPRELSMVSLPPYRIAPPDMLRIEVVKLVPRPSYRIGQFDVLTINVLGTLPKMPIQSYYLVEGDGNINLGPPYGSVRVAGLTIDEAKADITRMLQMILQSPEVTVQLARSSSVEQLTGPFQVEPDGVVQLRTYGEVYVAGMTAPEAQEAVRQRLALYFDSPQVGLDVVQFNSENYYVITEALGSRGNMWKFPITGNETVLDAIGQSQQMAAGISSKTIWLSRPAPDGAGGEQIFPVDWDAISRGGVTDTNYQIMPGDRIYIVDDSLVAANNVIGKVTNPIRRLLSITSLGASTVRSSEILGRDYNSRRRY